jgi:methionyl-tRNA formyltransferase
MSLRVVFMGTPDFAVPTLSEIIGRGHEVVAVYTRAPAAAGRGMTLKPSPVHRLAERFGLPVLTPPTLRTAEAAEAFRGHAADVAIVVAYGMILPKAILEAPPLGCLNLLASLLPRWRGAAPIERAIEAGDEETGVTIMRPIAELDAGPICLQRAEAIAPNDDYGSLAPRLSALGGELLVEALDDEPPFRDQPDQGITYAEKIDPTERLLDPARPADELERRVRALTPHIGSYVELDGGERLGVRRAALVPGADDVGPGSLEVRGGQVLYGAAQGVLELLEVQPPGKRAMDAAAWVRGRPT